LVATVQVVLASQATVGVEVMVVADVESVCPADVNVVEVAVMFQPAPDPVPSPTSKPWFEVTVWSEPFKVAENVMFPGADTNASEPAVSVAVAVDAKAAEGSTSAAIITVPAIQNLREIDDPMLPPRSGPKALAAKQATLLESDGKWRNLSGKRQTIAKMG
jgi:hypothetical protein